MIATIQPPTNPQTTYQADLVQKLVTLFGGLIIGLILGWWGHFLAIRRESRSRLKKAKDDFLAVIAQQRTKLKSMPRREDIFFVESILPLSEAVYRLQHILPSGQWGRLRQILTEYESHGREQFGGTREMLAAYFQTCQLPEQRLHGFLDRFYECVDK
jgi:hypothetical protein